MQLSHSYLSGCDCLIDHLHISNGEVWRIWHFPARLENKFFFSGAAAVRNRCGGGGQRIGKGKTGRFLSPYLLSANGKCNWQYSRTNTICPSSSWPGPRVRPAAGQSLQKHYTCSLGLGCRSCGWHHLTWNWLAARLQPAHCSRDCQLETRKRNIEAKRYQAVRKIKEQSMQEKE